MIFLISNYVLIFFDMVCSDKLNSDYLAMLELINEIGFLVQKSVNEGNQDLTPSDIEHILKMTTDVTLKMKSPNPKLTV